MTTLSPRESELLTGEEQLLSTTITAIKKREAEAGSGRYKLRARIDELIAESRAAKPQDLASITQQIHTLGALLQNEGPTELPDIRSPYFARLRVREKGKVKDFLLGPYPFLDGPVAIIDWRRAPRAKLYFNYQVGDQYEEDIGKQVLVGEVIDKAIITIEESQLLGLSTGGMQYFRESAQGTWQKDRMGANFNFSGGATGTAYAFGSGRGGRKGPDIAALLDPTQYAMLSAPQDEALLILGGAGCGKTTVALHRMAALHHEAPLKFKADQMAVVVPEEGIRQLSKRLLSQLGLEKTPCKLYDPFIQEAALSFLPTLPRRLSGDESSAIVSFKRHRAIEQAIPLLLESRAKNLAQLIGDKLSAGSGAAEIMTTKLNLPLIQRFEQARLHYFQSNAEVMKGWTQQSIDEAKGFFRNEAFRLWDINQDRLELFSRDEYLHLIVEASEGELTWAMAEEVRLHTREQGETLNASSQWGQLDSDRQISLTGSHLVSEALENKAGTIDYEDYAICVEIACQKVGKPEGPRSKIRTYQHIVIDEAQELAPLELKAIARTLAPGASLTIAGDAAQQSDPNTLFKSWGDQLKYLGLAHIKPRELKTSYRSTHEVSQFAHELLGHLAPAEKPKAPRHGPPVTLSALKTDAHAVMAIREALDQLLSKEPRSSTALICRNEHSAENMYRALEDLGLCRLVTAGDFSFKPGVDITTVANVKGLEFDYVIIPDATSLYYADKDLDRRALHVACTRAIHQLWVIAIAKPSKVLPKSYLEASHANT